VDGFKKIAAGDKRTQQAARRSTPAGAARYLAADARNSTKARNNRGRGHVCDLTKDDEAVIAKIIANGKCQITGLPFSLDPTPGNPFRPSLDRIDGTKGYSLGNIAVLCHFVNNARGAHIHVHDFKRICALVAAKMFPAEFKNAKKTHAKMTDLLTNDRRTKLKGDLHD
jgi:hypothetical protein